jgi:hypothetical protein
MRAGTRESVTRTAKGATASVLTCYEKYSNWRSGWDDTLRIASACSVVIVVNIIHALILFVPPQSAEALRVLAEDARFGLRRMFAMWFFALLLGVLSWWCARLTVSNLYPTARWWDGWSGRLARHLPRVLGCMPVVVWASPSRRPERAGSTANRPSGACRP